MTSPTTDVASELSLSLSALRLEVPDAVWEDVWEKAVAVLAELGLLRRTTRAVNDNALAWHAGEDGKANALNVIAVWTAEALAGRLHPSVAALTRPPQNAERSSS